LDTADLFSSHIMKNYSSNRAQKGKTAYRTPSMFRANKAQFAKNKMTSQTNNIWSKKK